MIKRKLKENKGGISIFTVMILVFLLPFAIWVGIEFPKMHETNERVKDAVDSSAASTVTLLDNSEYIEGKILFQSSDEIEESAREIFAMKMGLDYFPGTKTFAPKPGSNIDDESDIKVVVQSFDDNDLFINGVPSEMPISSVLMGTDGWNRNIKHPTIVVEAELTFKKIGWFGKDLTVTHVGMSQVKMNRNK